MTRGSPGPSQRRRTHGALEPSLWVQSHGTCGGVEALPIREAGSRAAEHVAASESTLTGRQSPIL
jgi:hypothetical protein